MENSKVDQDAIIRERLERMVALQQAMDQPRDELNDARRVAKAEGLNIEAIKALVPLVSKYPHDKAAGVLNEVIRYAEILGAEIRTSAPGAMSRSSPELKSEADAQIPVRAEVPKPAPSRRDLAAYAPLRLSTQVMAAVGLTIGLIWLLN